MSQYLTFAGCHTLLAYGRPCIREQHSTGEAFVEVRHSISGGADELAFLTGAEERIPQQESCSSILQGSGE